MSIAFVFGVTKDLEHNKDKEAKMFDISFYSTIHQCYGSKGGQIRLCTLQILEELSKTVVRRGLLAGLLPICHNCHLTMVQINLFMSPVESRVVVVD